MIWWKAIRPQTLSASISPVLMGSVMAFTTGLFDGMIFIITLITALGIQISCNLINDYQDFLKGADTPTRQGPLRVTAAGLITLPRMRKISFFSLACTALSGCYLIWHGGMIIALLLAISLLLAIIYTGGPFPLAYLGLGEFFVLLFFGPITISATYFLQTGIFSTDALLVGLGPGALSTAILIANNLRDEKEDRIALKKTLIVRFGTLFGKYEYLICLLVGITTPFYFMFTRPFTLIAVLTLLPASIALHTLFTHNHFSPLLPKTARLLSLHTLLFSIGWML